MLVGKCITKEGLDEILGEEESTKSIEAEKECEKGWADIVIETEGGKTILIEAKTHKEKDVGKAIRQIKSFRDEVEADELFIVTNWELDRDVEKLIGNEGIKHIYFGVNRATLAKSY